MSNKNVNIVANIILPVVVVVMTAVLFFMFRPAEATILFYLNLGYTIFLEVIFFGYINLLYRNIKTFSTPFYAVFGIYAAYYVTIGFGWMLVYSLGLSYFISIKIYVAGLIVLTLLWIIISVLTAQTDSNYKESVDKINNQKYTLEFYTQKIVLLASQYEKLCMEKNIKYQTDSNNRTALDKLKGKISFLTPNVLNDETSRSQLNTMLDKCEAIIGEIESAEEDKLTELDKKMQRFVNNSIDELNMLKNLTRK
jgi:hypothetical protein